MVVGWLGFACGSEIFQYQGQHSVYVVYDVILVADELLSSFFSEKKGWLGN